MLQKACLYKGRWFIWIYAGFALFTHKQFYCCAFIAFDFNFHFASKKDGRCRERDVYFRNFLSNPSSLYNVNILLNALIFTSEKEKLVSQSEWITALIDFVYGESIPFFLSSCLAAKVKSYESSIQTYFLEADLRRSKQEKNV